MGTWEVTEWKINGKSRELNDEARRKEGEKRGGEGVWGKVARNRRGGKAKRRGAEVMRRGGGRLK